MSVFLFAGQSRRIFIAADVISESRPDLLPAAGLMLESKAVFVKRARSAELTMMLRLNHLDPENIRRGAIRLMSRIRIRAAKWR